MWLLAVIFDGTSLEQKYDYLHVSPVLDCPQCELKLLSMKEN